MSAYREEPKIFKDSNDAEISSDTRHEPAAANLVAGLSLGGFKRDKP